MTQLPGGGDGRTLMAAVLFADLVGYSRKSVADQQTTKDSFRHLMQSVVAAVPEEARTMVDTGDGAAVAFLRDPEHALYAALQLRHVLAADPRKERRLGPEELRIGINLGPVRRAVDVNGRPNLIGDGMNAAERVMSFASPGHTTSSRSFRDAVERLHSSYTDLFEPLGARSDKHGREHEIYRLAESAPALAAATTSLRLMGSAPAPAPDRPLAGPRSKRQRVALVAAVAVTIPLVWLTLQRDAAEERAPPPSIPLAPKSVEIKPAPASVDSAPAEAAREPVESAVAAPVAAPVAAESAESKAGPVARPVRKAGEPREASPRCRSLTQKAGVGDISREESDELKRSCR